MKIHSYNEWDQLREIIVGTATNAHWPIHDPVYADEYKNTSWKKSPPPRGPVEPWIIEETNEDLDGLVKILEKHDVKVHRPIDLDFPALDGFSNYCPRDRFLVAGDTIVDVNMMYPCRDQEAHAYEFLLQHEHKVLTMPRDRNLICDAANICRLGDQWLFLESRSGNRAAAEWLSDQFPNIDIYGCNFYSGVHIDSTILPLREGVVMINGARVTKDNLPTPLKNWDLIHIDNVAEQTFHLYPWASKWIGMNVLSIDADTVIVDAKQTNIITMLEQRGFTVIPHTLRHARTLGGGFHCVTLDTWREN